MKKFSSAVSYSQYAMSEISLEVYNIISVFRLTDNQSSRESDYKIKHKK